MERFFSKLARQWLKNEVLDTLDACIAGHEKTADSMWIFKFGCSVRVNVPVSPLCPLVTA
ncbi:MAG: hypothetical protein OXE85_15705 [Roseovarius sp.]|nr:hypothetical protein [Roseovarius sp.]